MSTLPLKSKYWQELKAAAELGIPVPFSKPYVNYTEAELKGLVDEYIGDRYGSAQNPEQPAEGIDLDTYGSEALLPGPTTAPAREQTLPEQRSAQPVAPTAPPVKDWGNYAPETLARLLGVPFSDQASRRAGLTFNTHGVDDVLRVSSDGKIWYKDEVPKPAIPLPRMRRKITYVNTGVKTIERRLPNGQLDESFEVAGDGHEEAEIKITLPSSQVGIYYDPRLPFRVHTYNGRQGFDYMDVIRFYGGTDLVPSTITTLYVGDDLCFDIIKVRDTMERELRDRQLRKDF